MSSIVRVTIWVLSGGLLYFVHAITWLVGVECEILLAGVGLFVVDSLNANSLIQAQYCTIGLSATSSFCTVHSIISEAREVIEEVFKFKPNHFISHCNWRLHCL